MWKFLERSRAFYNELKIKIIPCAVVKYEFGIVFLGADNPILE